MQHEITPEFSKVLGPSRLENFNQYRHSVYGLDAAFNLAYLNCAWFEFASQNGSDRFDVSAWSLGKNIFTCIPDTLLPFYQKFFNTALTLAPDSSVTPMRAEYECSSPELYRKFAMHLYPLGKDGIVVAHSLLVEEIHALDNKHKFDANNYLNHNGSILQCANCRRVKNLKTPQQWDWVPHYVENPAPSVSHGVCDLCANHYYLAS
tara:strand:+ start:222190 stop:222807 length:618 start_codon:yes stop_codon:yes gene_type:complete